MSNAQLFNNWAVAPNDVRCIDVADWPDRQLVLALLGHDVGLAINPDVLQQSAMAEITRRANNLRITVAEFILRGPR
jgi:hypothetical protein